MKLAIIVSEFPKTTETFILRDLLQFRRLGMEVRLYYLSLYRHGETLHEFANSLLDCVHHQNILLSARAWTALARTAARRGPALRLAVSDLRDGYRSEPVLLAKSLGLLPKMAAIVEDMQEWGADHIHAEFAGHPGTAAWIAHRLTAIPYSISCRAHDIFRSQALLDRKLSEAAFVRTISEFNKNFLLDRVAGLSGAAIHVIHSSLDTADIAPLPPAGRTDDFDILYVGGLRRHKGVDVLLRAVASAVEAGARWRLTAIGDGPENRRLRTLAHRLNIADRVLWRGSQPFEVIRAAYAAADVVVAPSVIGAKGRTEGIPNVMIEALAHQRPAIATRVSGLPELIEDGVSGHLVEPGNVEALLRALTWVAAHPEEAHAMAVRGRRHVEQHFDLQMNARRQVALFSNHCRAVQRAMSAAQ